jgi:hypothetical protein
MAHAIRHEGFDRKEAGAPRAKALRPAVSAHGSEGRSERRPTLPEMSRQSGIQRSRQGRRRLAPSLGACLAEEIVADLSKDPRHDQ